MGNEDIAFVDDHFDNASNGEEHEVDELEEGEINDNDNGSDNDNDNDNDNVNDETSNEDEEEEDGNQFGQEEEEEEEEEEEDIEMEPNLILQSSPDDTAELEAYTQTQAQAQTQTQTQAQAQAQVQIPSQPQVQVQPIPPALASVQPQNIGGAVGQNALNNEAPLNANQNNNIHNGGSLANLPISMGNVWNPNYSTDMIPFKTSTSYLVCIALFNLYLKNNNNDNNVQVSNLKRKENNFFFSLSLIAGWHKHGHKAPYLADDSSAEGLWEEEADQFILHGISPPPPPPLFESSKSVKHRGIYNGDGTNSHSSNSYSRPQKQKRSNAEYTSSLTGMYHHKRRKLNSDIKKVEWKHFTGPNPTKCIYARAVGYGYGLQGPSNKREKFFFYLKEKKDNTNSFYLVFNNEDSLKLCPYEKSKDREKDKSCPKPLDVDERSLLGIDQRLDNKSEKLDGWEEKKDQREKKEFDEKTTKWDSRCGLNEDNITIPSCIQRKKDNNSVLLFLKYFDVYHQSLSVVGSVIIAKDALIVHLAQFIRIVANWSSEREIILWEEEDCDNGKIQALEESKQISDCQLVDGDIVVFQEKSSLLPLMHLPDAKVCTFHLFSSIAKHDLFSK
ncbi:UBP-type zinc finger-containing protein [Reticulomyxa filosa]|uniref:UBP-type zinc finger-containing protein n=1 Tax=Reticulomyxa filosa TaxID=46433 RepID=X6N6Z6_RETFI|nr:UBP-type zinc finger-containing protein [Reticulomyxa filosa]|eukprot:ETO22045.1 UBP-type zinc finger-containing protein [Reticulomyxa filosa]